jgi:hypothetical protein
VAKSDKLQQVAGVAPDRQLERLLELPLIDSVMVAAAASMRSCSRQRGGGHETVVPAICADLRFVQFADICPTQI